MQPLKQLIANSEDWLMERTLFYARRQDYTRYTSTLTEAWRLSIAELSQAFTTACDTYSGPPELGPDEDYTRDPIAAFGILEAQRHRTRGITIAMFMGLLKYYKQSYLDLAGSGGFDPKTETVYRLFIERAFDRVEIGFASEWVSQSESDKMEELRATNREMTNEKNKYLTIFESLNEPALLLDELDRIKNINHAGLALFRPEAVPGEIYYEETPGDALFPWLVDELELAAASNAPERHFEKSIQLNGTRRVYMVKLKRMLDVSQRYSGTIVLLEEITEQKRAEAELQALANELRRSNTDLEQFAYVASHDLQEPLRTICGFAKLFDNQYRDTFDETAREYMDFIHAGGSRMQQLIKDLLSYSRVGRADRPMEPVDLNALMDQTLDTMRQHITDTGAVIEYDPLPTVTGDRLLLAQLLQNLVGNALKYRREEVPRIRISAQHTSAEALQGYQLAITDNGLGVTEKDRERIFKLFERSHGDTPHTGTGIGLAVCKKIAEYHGGRIWVESAPGHGSVFCFTLPAAAAETEPAG